MPDKIKEYRKLSDRTALQIIDSYADWTAFLTVAVRLYKYSYHEQLMIYAQRPDAIACAEFDVWNKTMHRYVRSGSKGIALIDTTADTPKIRYVFDVSDTGSRRNSRPMNLWEMHPEHTDIVAETLENCFNIAVYPDLRDQFENVASHLSEEYWIDHHREIIDIIADSFLEEYDIYSIGARFRNASAVSIAYTLMSRCGMNPDEYFTHEDFLSIFDFNTPAVIHALGTAVSEISEQVLRQIEITIKKYERTHEHETERTDLHAERGLYDSRPQTERTGDETAGQVRQNAEELSAGTPPDHMEQHDPVGDPVPPSSGDRRDSEPEIIADDAGNGEIGGSDGKIEGIEPDGMDETDKQPESTGRGSNSERTDLQLTEPERPVYSRGEQLSLFPSEDEQIEYISEAEAQTSAFSAPVFMQTVPQNTVDHILRMGGNSDNTRMQLVTEYSKGKSLEEITALLQKLYHGGNGIVIDSGRYSAWYAEDGIHISSGDSAQYMTSAQIVSWEDAAKRIGELLDSGQFAANVETAEARTWELKTAAEHLWYLHHDFADNVHDEYFDAAMWRGGFPDSTERIADMLRDDAIREIIIAETARFAEAYRKDSSVMRFHFYKPDNILKELTESGLPRREYTSEMAELPEVQQFITEDEINAALNRGGSVEGGKIRIYEFFTADHTLQEQADFLRNEYGTGGYSHAVSGMTHSGADYSSKGLVLKKPNCPEVQLSWSKVAGRYTDLIKKDRYFTPEEQQQYELLHAQTIARNATYEEYQRIKAEHPENIVLYQAGDFFELYGEDARTAADILEISLTTRRLNTVGAVPMCGIPVHTLEANIKKLREKYDVTIASVKEVYSLKKQDPEPTVEPDEPPVKTEITEDDIREAFRNLDFERKIQVQEYMQEHGRERKTAAWLAEMYGGDVSAPHYVTVTGVDGSVELSWSKIQRIIGGMVNAGTYLTFAESEELDRRNRRAAIENLSDEQQLIVKAMETAGFLYAYAASGIEFHAENDGHPLTFDSWEQAYVWIDSAELAGEPGLREKVQAVLHWDDSPEEPDYIIETTAVYSGEEHNLPYDVVFQTIKTDPPAPLVPDAQNFRITDDNLGVGGSKAKYQANINAIRLLKTLEEDGLQALPEQQEVLSRYVGWGGLADAFDESKDNWKNEYAELKSLLTPEEYAAVRASTLNAHYTSPTVIKAMYEAIENMGFRTGNVLEPSMGVGNFFGLLPDNLSESRLYGVELDSITGRIAKQLYPKADITVAGFETTNRPNFFDLAIGNVPFGNYQVNDRDYNKLGFSIHNYFFAKSLDQIRPGGVIAFVTSHYTMDSKDTSVRKYLAKRAELLGAIRLPNNAFKANAGTEVTTDIIFLQKRDRPMDIQPDWVYLGVTPDNIPVNSYFADHPEMVLGTLKLDDMMYGNSKEVTCKPIEGANLADQLHEAVQHIGGMYKEAELPDLGEGDTIRETIPADPNVKNYSYTVVDGDVYYRENSVMVQPEFSGTAKERIKGMVGMRDCVQKLIEQQMNGYSDSEIQETQTKLNQLYDSFTAKYGLINSRANALSFADDSSYYLLCSLEILDEDNNLKRKADMFTKRTIKPHEVVTSVDTASEALALSISEKACVDMEYMSSLTGKTEQELAAELRGVVYMDFDRTHDGSYTYRTADDFLSGNVREKLKYYMNELRWLTPEADHYTEIFDNVTALQSAQPKDLDASEIEVRLGATWIDRDYYHQFMLETFNPPHYIRRSIDINYSPATAEWNITNKANAGRSNINAYMTYGTERANAYKILEDTLNLRDVRIYDTVTDPDGKERRVLNSKETTLAQQKQQTIKDAFRDWIWQDADRRQELTQKYNKLFNSTRPREYNGSHITFSGMNPEITLREHQLNAVAHILYSGNTLLAHEVGAGKTFEMVAAAMESKRLGLCQKPLFAVPNHLTEQWASEFLRLYPSANILVASKKDFEPANRKKFCARIATGNYDAVIIGHSQFEKIPMSKERQERLLHEQIMEIEEGLEELKASRAEKFTIKSLERTKKSLEIKLKKLQDDTRKDDVITFEQLGVDRLYVDEAHNYKNLFLYTKMRNVAGLSTTDAQKSSDMLLKCRYIDEITGNRGIVFATGTPVSNSMTELFTMMRYLQHDTLQKKGLAHFDCWASTFGETTTAIELAPEGTGYRARTRFSKFFNLPELMNMFKEVADIKTSDQLNLPVPKAVYHNEVTQPTEIQQGMVKELSERASKIHTGTVDPSIDNMLKVTSDGRKLGLDQRIINSDLPDDPMSKVNLCVDNIFRIWEDSKADRLTQLVFSDLSTPKKQTQNDKIAAKSVSAEVYGIAESIDIPTESAFIVYEDIRDKLIARGVPKSEIAFIHDADTEVKKKDLFAKVRSGTVRVLIGSTQKMGAGTNVRVTRS